MVFCSIFLNESVSYCATLSDDFENTLISGLLKGHLLTIDDTILNIIQLMNITIFDYDKRGVQGCDIRTSLLRAPFARKQRQGRAGPAHHRTRCGAPLLK